MKKDEKIIISKQLAIDLIWWLEHADVPFNDYGYWISLRPPTQMEIARDSMVDELEKALVAKKGAKQVWLTLEEAKEIAVQMKRNADFFFFQTDEFDNDTDALLLCLNDKIEKSEG